ncbi:MAG: Rieske (2Fe-2S) protein [Anaerolineales bacterium]|jgi:Rieske Fe-S protein|nr:Rieske (2Fe-2S) protein [Anaerolineales bacterium]
MTPIQGPVSRRGFIKLVNGMLAALGLGAFAAPAVAYFWPSKLVEVPTEPVAVGPADELKVGDARTISYGRYPAIVLNTPAGLRAYTAVCTHFACLVKYDGEKDVIACPCHAGYFRSDDGAVIEGPPPKALKALAWFVKDNTLYVGGEA